MARYLISDDTGFRSELIDSQITPKFDQLPGVVGTRSYRHSPYPVAISKTDGTHQR